MPAFLMKNVVSVPSTNPCMPCTNLRISFPYDFLQVYLYLMCLIKCQYSSNVPVSPSKIAPANSNNNFSRNFCVANFFVVSEQSRLLMVASAHSWVKVCVLYLAFIFSADLFSWFPVSLSLWVIWVGHCSHADVVNTAIVLGSFLTLRLVVLFWMATVNQAVFYLFPFVFW